MDKVQLPVKVYPTLKRSVEECAKVRGLSASDEVALLVQASLPAERQYLGLGEGDPLEVTSGRLAAHLEVWEGEFSVAELDAVGRVREALERIAEKRTRESS